MKEKKFYSLVLTLSVIPLILITNNANAWIANGVVICTAIDDQQEPQICTDGKGGAIITWRDRRSDPYGDIYAQHIDSNGAVRWTANGTAICTADDNQQDPQICTDGKGGAIITWRDRRSDSDGDIYAQHIDFTGDVQWEDNGMAICTVIDNQHEPQICTDGDGGAIITWMDERNGSYSDIYAQHIDSNGAVRWTANGTAICTADDNQQDPQICTDGKGGAIITWFDFRNGLNYDIYAQHINSNGNVQWEANGTIICNIYLSQRYPQICTDGKGGAIITWFDNRRDPYGDIYAQHIDSNGAVQWTANGTEICIALRNQLEPQICTDGEGGAIITWFDRRSGLNYDIYAQRIKNVIGGRIIPLGNFYLLFTIISLVSLIILEKYWIFRKSKLQAKI